jgi:hypothetical protein
MFSIYLTKLTMIVSSFRVTWFKKLMHFTWGGLLDFLEHCKHTGRCVNLVRLSQIASAPIKRIDTHAHHCDRSVTATIFANGTYFMGVPRNRMPFVTTFIQLCSEYVTQEALEGLWRLQRWRTNNSYGEICWFLLNLFQFSWSIFCECLIISVNSVLQKRIQELFLLYDAQFQVSSSNITNVKINVVALSYSIYLGNIQYIIWIMLPSGLADL